MPILGRAWLTTTVLGLAALLGGCVASTDESPEGDTVDSSASETGVIASEVYGKYGVHPKDYASVFNAGTANEKDLHRDLEPVTVDMSNKLDWTNAGVDVDMVEVATFFMTNTRDAMLDDAYSVVVGVGPGPIHGLVENLKAVTPFLTSDVIFNIDKPDCIKDGQVVCLSFRHSLVAHAAYYIWAKGLAGKAAERVDGRQLRYLPAEAQFYWAAAFATFGVDKATAYMKKNGLDFWSKRWDRTDDHDAYGDDMRYNLTWRTATEELMRRTVFGHLEQGEPPHDHEPGCTWSSSQNEWPDDRAQVVPSKSFTDSGVGRFGGLLSQPTKDVDFYAIQITEASYGSGMCVRAKVSSESTYDGFRLCATHHGSYDSTMCADASGTLQYDVDHAVTDDSGVIYFSVSRDGPVDECSEYIVDYSVTAEECPCIGNLCAKQP